MQRNHSFSCQSALCSEGVFWDFLLLPCAILSSLKIIAITYLILFVQAIKVKVCEWFYRNTNAAFSHIGFFCSTVIYMQVKICTLFRVSLWNFDKIVVEKWVLTCDITLLLLHIDVILINKEKCLEAENAGAESPSGCLSWFITGCDATTCNMASCSRSLQYSTVHYCTVQYSTVGSALS